MLRTSYCYFFTTIIFFTIILVVCADIYLNPVASEEDENGLYLISFRGV